MVTPIVNPKYIKKPKTFPSKLLHPVSPFLKPPTLKIPTITPSQTPQPTQTVIEVPTYQTPQIVYPQQVQQPIIQKTETTSQNMMFILLGLGIAGILIYLVVKK